MYRRIAFVSIIVSLLLTPVFASGSSDSSGSSTGGMVSDMPVPNGTDGSPPEGTPPGPPPDGKFPGGAPGGKGSKGNPPGQAPALTDQAPATLASTYSQSGGTVVKTGRNFSSTDVDSSVIYVNEAGSLTLEHAVISKKGDSSSNDTSNFYGQNAAVVASGGASITLKNVTVSTSGDGANAVFSTGTGSKISISGLTINTEKNSSRGLDATHGGTIIADQARITTAGAHCAALATDRGEGTVIVTRTTGVTSGEGSPGIYSTGAISATDSSFSASGSEAAVIEGKNSITLTNTSLSGAKLRGVMMYQSFSGDAGTGTSVFTMTGGTLSALSGPLFYITNTEAVIILKGSALKGESDVLLAAGADRWGKSGSNGGHAVLKASGQILSGSVSADKLSSAALELASGSSFSGALDAARAGGAVSLSLDASSSWNVTADSHVSSLNDADSGFANINSNGFTVYYDASVNGNLGRKIFHLPGGGKLVPAE